MAALPQTLDGGVGSWSEHAELRMLIAWAAGGLNDTERYVICAALLDNDDAEAAKISGMSVSGVGQARRQAMRKMRHRLEALGIHSVAEVLS